MNPYVYAGLTCLFGMITYFLAAIKFYKAGYNDAIDDVIKVTQELNAGVKKVLESNED